MRWLGEDRLRDDADHGGHRVEVIKNLRPDRILDRFRGPLDAQPEDFRILRGVSETLNVDSC